MGTVQFDTLWRLTPFFKRQRFLFMSPLWQRLVGASARRQISFIFLSWGKKKKKDNSSSEKKSGRSGVTPQVVGCWVFLCRLRARNLRR